MICSFCEEDKDFVLNNSEAVADDDVNVTVPATICMDCIKTSKAMLDEQSPD